MSSAGLSLDALQTRFARAVTRSAKPRRRANFVVDAPPLAAADRLGIYRFAFDARLRGVLGNGFAGVRRLLGDAEFARVAAAYVRARPSRHPNLNRLGAGFPAFLARCRGLRDRAFAVELATLELALSQAHDTSQGEPLDVASLARVVDPSRARLPLQPSARVFAFRFPVGRWYSAFVGGRVRRAPRPRVSWMVVHRAGWNVIRAEVDREQYQVLRQLARGATLVDALRDAPTGAPVRRWFGTWARAGLFAGQLERPTSP